MAANVSASEPSAWMSTRLGAATPPGVGAAVLSVVRTAPDASAVMSGNVTPAELYGAAHVPGCRWIACTLPGVKPHASTRSEICALESLPRRNSPPGTLARCTRPARAALCEPEHDAPTKTINAAA